MFEMLAQSKQQMGARDFHHSKQQVFPFYRVSQLLHEKNVIRFPENGAQVSPFSGWLDWELFACRATSPSGFRTTSNKSFIQSCFKEIFEEAEITHAPRI